MVDRQQRRAVPLSSGLLWVHPASARRDNDECPGRWTSVERHQLRNVPRDCEVNARVGRLLLRRTMGTEAEKVLSSDLLIVELYAVLGIGHPGSSGSSSSVQANVDSTIKRLAGDWFGRWIRLSRARNVCALLNQERRVETDDEASSGAGKAPASRRRKSSTGCTIYARSGSRRMISK